MSGILRLESLTKGNTLKQGDKTPLKYRLFDADGEKLSIAGKSAKVRLVYPDFLTIGYEKDGLTVAQDDTVTFTIDRVIPSRIYHVEIIVDDQFIFPSRADESKFTVDKSSLGAETNIIEIVGKDILIREVKSQVDTELQPLVTSLESAEQAETQRASEESSRASAEAQRKIDHANRSAELDSKADKVILKNMLRNGDFSKGRTGWTAHQGAEISVVDSRLKVDATISNYSGATQVIDFKHEIGDVYYSNFSVENPNDYDIELNVQHVRSTYYIKIPAMFKGSVSELQMAHQSSARVNYFITKIDSSDQFTYFIDNITLLNLTNIFGTGNEPTKEQMDELFKTIGYIDGEYALNNEDLLMFLMSIISEKVNTKQEDWITPTLANGSTGNLQYRKNDFGRVEFRGEVTMATSGNDHFMSLPTGYNNTGRMRVAVISEGGAVSSYFLVVNGAFYRSAELVGETVTFNDISIMV